MLDVNLVFDSQQGIEQVGSQWDYYYTNKIRAPESSVQVWKSSLFFQIDQKQNTVHE